MANKITLKPHNRVAGLVFGLAAIAVRLVRRQRKGRAIKLGELSANWLAVERGGREHRS